MSRSGYSENWEDNWRTIIWRGAVASAMRGKRGQAFLQEMLAALDAMPEKKLIAHQLEQGGEVCAIGAVGKARGLDMTGIDPTDRDTVAEIFGIAPALAAEIVWENDEACSCYQNEEKPEVRFARMRAWVEAALAPSAPTKGE